MLGEILPNQTDTGFLSGKVRLCSVPIHFIHVFYVLDMVIYTIPFNLGGHFTVLNITRLANGKVMCTW